ncbi:hypothetical protein TRAPUB_4696, partial [Trametes pubescens]
MNNDDVAALEGQLEDTVLGASAFDIGNHAEAPAGMAVEDWVPITMVADDGVDQETITRSIEESSEIDESEMSRRYDELKTYTLKMSTLEQLHKTEDQTRALALLSRKNRLLIDDKYRYDIMHPNLLFKMHKVYMDHRLLIGRELGFDLLLPNLNVLGVEQDHSWQFHFQFDKRFHQFGGDVRMFGCDMAGRMLRIGTTRADEEVWLALVPTASFDAPIPPHKVKLSKNPTVMRPELSLAMITSILHGMDQAGVSDISLPVPPYPDNSSSKSFNLHWSLKSRPGIKLSVANMRRFCNSYKTHFWSWYTHDDAPAGYSFSEIDDSVPVVAILSYGKNSDVGNGDIADEPTISAVADMWEREVDYAHAWKMTVAFASHYSCTMVPKWENLNPHILMHDNPVLYDSANPSTRKIVEDLASYPEKEDDDQRERRVYTPDGVQVPRRRARGLRACDRGALLQDLSSIHSLFTAPIGVDDSDLEVDAMLDDDFDSEDDPPARSSPYAHDVSYTCYPHMFSKNIGQWQANGIIRPMVPHIQSLSKTLTQPGSGGQAITGLNSQCYNTMSHRMR